jgi:hypothetical protein
MYGDASERARRAEQAGLSAEQQALVKQLRGLTDARQSRRRVPVCRPKSSLYLAGAVAFATAIMVWRRILQQSAGAAGRSAPLRSTWAAYSLGRALFAMSAEAGDVIEVLEDARRPSVKPGN